MAEIEGTYTLDGMLQGPIPAQQAESMERNLKEWTKSASESGFPFSLQIEAGQFSLLCGNDRQKITTEGISIADTLVQSINALIETFPPETRGKLFSTIRSTEIVPGAAIKGLYMIGNDGLVRVETRQVDAETEADKGPLEKKEILKLGLISAAIIALFLLISAFFVPYKKWFGGAKNRFTVLKLDDIEFDNRLYQSYIEIQPEKLDKYRSGSIKLKIKRGSNWQEITAPEFQLDGNKISWNKFLTLANLKRGSIPCTIHTTGGSGITYERRIPISALAAKDETSVFLSLPADGLVKKVIFSL